MRALRRSKLEVLMDILKVVAQEKGAKKTKILYKANLAWNVLSDALETLESRGVIVFKETPTGVVVEATAEGLEVLNKYCSVESALTERMQGAEELTYAPSWMTILH